MSMVEDQVRAWVEELGDDPSDEIRRAAWLVWAERELGEITSAGDVADLIDDALRRYGSHASFPEAPDREAWVEAGRRLVRAYDDRVII